MDIILFGTGRKSRFNELRNSVSVSTISLLQRPELQCFELSQICCVQFERSLSTTHASTIGSRPLIKQFMRGVFNLRPQLPSRSPIWNPDDVLTYLRSLAPATSLSLPQLSKKLLMLMLLTTGQRGQTIMKCSIKNMTVKPSRVYFGIDQLLKTSKPGTHHDKIVFQSYPVDRRLHCLVCQRIPETHTCAAEIRSVVCVLYPSS